MRFAMMETSMELRNAKQTAQEMFLAGIVLMEPP